MIKQISSKQLVLEEKQDESIKQKYIDIDSKEGQKLIKEHNIEIDPNIKDL